MCENTTKLLKQLKNYASPSFSISAVPPYFGKKILYGKFGIQKVLTLWFVAYNIKHHKIAGKITKIMWFLLKTCNQP